MESFDAAVIGGGLLGCFAARELSRWKLDVVLLEAREDVCTGISRANTAVIYPGYDHKPGSLKAEMTVRANASFDRLCGELDVPFSRCGSLMLSFGPRADAVLRKKLLNGEENGVAGLRLLDAADAYALEPGLAPGLRHALFSSTAGTVNPWQLGIAACENAVHNGAQLRLNTKVEGLSREAEGYLLETDRGTFRARAVVNCAGLSADRVQALVCPTELRIVPTAGDYLIMDRNSAVLPAHILEYEPEEKTKGLTIVPTVEGSLLLGPSERGNTLDYATTADGLAWVRERAARLLPGLDFDGTIRSFAAVRPNPERPDGRSIHSFCIEHPAERFWSLIGIKTPGLTCARELGRHVAAALARELHAEENTAFDPTRRAIQTARALAFDERRKLAAAEPDYGEIVCCCEDVTRGEILEAIRRGACTVDGVKRRVGAGMGRCQGARCEQKIAALLSEALGIPAGAVTKDGRGTEISGERSASAVKTDPGARPSPPAGQPERVQTKNEYTRSIGQPVGTGGFYPAEHVELLIVGAGAAGLSAAISAWDAGCRDILIADRASVPGGVLPQCIHAGFGLAAYGEELSGPQYAERLLAGLARTGVRLSLGTEVLSVSGDKTALLTQRGHVSRVRFERLILASGCREKSIGALSVAGTRPAGIFTAGQAQEMINLRHQDPGGDILILGSGDLGMIMARRFTLEGKRVIAVLEQAAHYGGMARNFHRCMEAYHIPLRCRMTVRAIHGQGRVSGVTAEHLDSGEQEFIACRTLVTALGLIPERTLAQGLEASSWLSFAGNCCRVYDIVDSAASQAQRIGHEAGTAICKHTDSSV